MAQRRHFLAYRQYGQSGITLIELLVVLTILGLAASVVVLNAPPTRPPARTEAEAFAAQLNLASQKSLIEGRLFRLETRDGEYRFTRLSKGEWETAPGLVVQSLPSGISIAVETDAPENKNALGLNQVRGTPLVETDEENPWTSYTIDPIGPDTGLLVRFESARGDWVVRLRDNGGAEVMQL